MKISKLFRLDRAPWPLATSSRRILGCQCTHAGAVGLLVSVVLCWCAFELFEPS